MADIHTFIGSVRTLLISTTQCKTIHRYYCMMKTDYPSFSHLISDMQSLQLYRFIAKHCVPRPVNRET